MTDPALDRSATWPEIRPAAAASRFTRQYVSSTRRMCEIHADQVWTIGIAGLGLSSYGPYLAKNNLSNVPARTLNSQQLKNPTIALPMTFYYVQQ